MNNEFSQLHLHAELVQAVVARGYTAPTPIQSAVIPEMLAGHDILGQAQTGTGKTAAFALPILQNLTPGQGAVQALVVAPTRELAMQVARAMYEYGRFHGVTVLPVYGGQPYERQIRRLQKGVDVVVGTPGRLLDLMRQKALDLRHVQTVVLDEADEMLSLGFIEDIEAILQQTPAGRQTALFSATLPAPIRQLAQKYMRDPQSITIERQQLTVESIEQRYYLVHASDKLAAMTLLFEAEEISRALIFTRTRVAASDLADALTARGFPADALHGELGQQARERILERFRQNQCQVLVATDVAARGLDIENISHVFNYDLPQDPEVYVHRIGRTGRAGKTGIAISLWTPSERWRLQQIESYTRQPIARGVLPTAEEIQARREERLLEQIKVWIRRKRYRREWEMVADLVEEGHEPLEIAAAALKLARGEERQRPIMAVREIEERPPMRERRQRQPGKRQKGAAAPAWQRDRGGAQSHEPGMVRLVLDAGKIHGVRIGEIVGTIAAQANIPGSAIGKIRVQDAQTLVDVPEQFVRQVLDKSNVYRINRRVVSLVEA
ncbi:MAG: DEAD/DEAH box helicase [Caldilineaceae bacterium]